MANYEPTSFQFGDFVNTERMNSLANNEQYLYENLIDIRYNSYGINRDTGMKILAGTIVLPAAPNQDHTRGTVQFGGFFTAGSHPVVTATPMIGQDQRLGCTVYGIGRLEITSTGFGVVVCQFETKKPNVIRNAMRVNYVAIGY